MQTNGDPAPPFADCIERVNRRCEALIGRLAEGHGRLGEAMRYSVLAGGKRLRPLLVVTACNAWGGSRGERPDPAALDAACAVEFLHTYTLIHDDLPCMDDDDFRRGRASAHRRFDEATAVLSGDALLTAAFEVFGDLPDEHGTDPARALSCARALARGGGGRGVVAGQVLDLEGAERAGRDDVERIHRLKTGALIGASLEIGAILGGAGAAEAERARAAGELAGVGFQIMDDVLDAESTREVLGKTPGKDVDRGRLSYVGVDRAGARARARDCVEQARGMLPGGEAFAAVGTLFEMMVDREK